LFKIDKFNSIINPYAIYVTLANMVVQLSVQFVTCNRRSNRSVVVSAKLQLSVGLWLFPPKYRLCHISQLQSSPAWCTVIPFAMTLLYVYVTSRLPAHIMASIFPVVVYTLCILHRVP